MVRRPESELLPEGFTCPKCNSSDFRKETDILDVWFDSGSSCVAVLETRGKTSDFLPMFILKVAINIAAGSTPA